MNIFTTSRPASAIQRVNNQSNPEYGTQGFVYALGYVKPFFPVLNLEKQYKAALAVIKPEPKNYLDVFNYKVSPKGKPQLSYRPFLYLAQEASWVFSINNVDTYLISPRTPTQLNALIQTSGNVDTPCILVGQLAQPGFTYDPEKPALPTAMLDHLIDQTQITSARYKNSSPADNALVALKPNIGRSDVQRARNYFQSHFHQINEGEQGSAIVEQIAGVDFNVLEGDSNGNISNKRDIVQIIVICPDRSRYACSIDVTNMYPFVSCKLSPFAKSN